MPGTTKEYRLSGETLISPKHKIKSPGHSISALTLSPPYSSNLKEPANETESALQIEPLPEKSVNLIEVLQKFDITFILFLIV